MKMKNWLLFVSIVLCCSSCDTSFPEKFNEEAYDEYQRRNSSGIACSMGGFDILYVDMNKPNFEFYLEDKKLDFNGLQNLDTFLLANKTLLENYRITR